MPRIQRGHEPIEHTADVGLRIWAPDLDALFAEAAVALIDVMGTARGPAERREHVELEAPDLEALFVDWLSEVLFLFDAREFVTRSARPSVARDPWRVTATLDGGGELQQHGPAVKAVTYHGMDITESPTGYEARVYLDV
jgi:SHS2 domain-containing protein